jgi:histidyl-tRNA synthetase
MAAFQTVKGFRDFFPEDCARRNYIFDQWRRIAHRYGFAEYEGALIEPTALYKKKSGDEITSQLFNFVDKGGREIALRPEVTPTLARLVAERQRHYTKPMKWFQIGSCFRYEEPQRGRTREFTQLNVDIIGENSPAADAELIAVAIDLMLSLGLTGDDFSIRLSDRRLWSEFLMEQNIDVEHSPAFLTIIDKLERVPGEVTDKKLQAIGLTLAQVKAFIASVDHSRAVFTPLAENLKARGLWEFVHIDPGIVRGLAYYTGTVFEVFDLKHNLRAVAGGGRYDNLVSLLSDGGVDMPACGFAMGDVVLNELINRTDEAKVRAEEWNNATHASDAYVVIADEAHRSDALGILQRLRNAALRTDYSLTPAKVGKQFQSAETRKARFAIVIGGEWPTVVVKNLRTRDQMEVPAEKLIEKLSELMPTPDYLPRLA